METQKTPIRPNTGDGLPTITQSLDYRYERGAIVHVEIIFAAAHNSNDLKPVSAIFSGEAAKMKQQIPPSLMPEISRLNAKKLFE